MKRCLCLVMEKGRSVYTTLKGTCGEGKGVIHHCHADGSGTVFFHSLLEGAVLGAQETITNSMHIFIAIVSHKGLAAYALGSSIIESQVEYVCVCVCVFSCMFFSSLLCLAVWFSRLPNTFVSPTTAAIAG